VNAFPRIIIYACSFFFVASHFLNRGRSTEKLQFGSAKNQDGLQCFASNNAADEASIIRGRLDQTWRDVDYAL